MVNKHVIVCYRSEGGREAAGGCNPRETRTVKLQEPALTRGKAAESCGNPPEEPPQEPPEEPPQDPPQRPRRWPVPKATKR